jgi:chromosome segregation ATPase
LVRPHSLNAQISGSSANIALLQSQVTAAESEAEQVERRRAAYDEMLTAQDVEIPDTADEFWNLREELLTQATEMLAKFERNREASTDAEYAQKSARIARDAAAKELKRVEHSARRCRSSRSRCANTSAPQSVPM